MTRPRKFPTIWAERIQRLIWATGERHAAMSKRFGTSTAAIVNGTKKRFTVDFVRRLQLLEAQFAADLKALADHEIKIVYNGGKWRRYDYRRNKQSIHRQTLGDVGLSREPVSGPPQKAVSFAYRSRNFTAIHRANEPRRPATAEGRSRVASRGVS